MKSDGIGIGENWRPWPNTSFGFNISRTWNGRHASVYRTCRDTQSDQTDLPASIAGPGGQTHLATRGRGKIVFPSGNSHLARPTASNDGWKEFCGRLAA